MNDPLRERLAGTDPLRHRDGDHTFPAAPPPELLERIMSTPVITPTPESGAAARPAGRRPRWALALGGVAAASLAAVGAFAVLRDDSSPAPAATAPLVLQLGDDSMAMCMQFSVDILADFPVAFEGTVESVTDGQVTLRVDRWYRGGDATTVTLMSSSTSVALVGGADFRAGGQYLVTASDGAVSVCGYTGEATPELRAYFDQAFGG
jgi:hypothetical protein